MTGDPYKYDIFLRYHRAQARWVKQLAERLDREGFRVWLDVWMLQPGDDRRVELRRAIDECRWIALVLSPEFVANAWPKDELYSGFPHAPKSQNQRLLPLIHSDCDLPAPVQDLEGFDFRGSDDDPIAFEFQALQLMAFLDPSIAAPSDLQRFRLHFQRSQAIEDEQVSGWQSFVRSLQSLMLNIAGGSNRQTPLTQEETQQLFFLNWIQRLFQWNTADVQFDRAESYWNQGNWTEALAAYDRALNIDANFALAWGRRGDVLVKLGRYGEAVNSYNGSLNLNPYDEGIRLRLAMIQGRLKRYKSAVVSYDKVLEMDPDNAVVWHNRSLRLAQLGRPTLALKSVDKALELQPRLWKSWLLKGHLLYDLKRYPAAIPCFRWVLSSSVLRTRDRQVMVWRHYALVLAKANRTQPALASVKRALALNPKDWRAWHNRGVLLLRVQRYRAAIQCFDRAFQGDPDNPRIWHARGMAFQSLDLWQDALIHYEEALKVQATYFPAAYALAVALQQVGQDSQAVEQFAALHQQRPRLVICVYGQIQSLRRLRKVKTARALARTLTEQHERDPWGWFALAMIATDQQDWENAVLYFSHVITLNGRDSTAYNNRAWSLCQLGRYSEAVQDVKDALALADRATYWHTLGVIQQQQGDPESAQHSWQQALDRDPECTPAQESLATMVVADAASSTANAPGSEVSINS
ncbi:MAG: hypothetical protein OHK0012_09420 [Synechococcales cyanobacterium]